MNGLSYEYMFIPNKCNCLKGESCCCVSDKKKECLCEDLNLLSVKSRIDIIFILKNKPHYVGDIVAHTNMSQSLVSHHLADLTKAGFIGSKKEGKFSQYFLTDKGKKVIPALELIINS